jgi:hypothetical protein
MSPCIRPRTFAGTDQTKFGYGLVLKPLEIVFTSRLEVFRIAESFLNHTDFCCDVAHIFFCKFLFLPQIPDGVVRHMPSLPPPVPKQTMSAVLVGKFPCDG